MASNTLSTVENLFKIKYMKKSKNTFNASHPLLGMVRKEEDFVGKRIDGSAEISFSGGVGSGTLPTANYANIEDPQITSKKTYATLTVDREALLASASDEGAFERLMAGRTAAAVKSFVRNYSRQLFNDGTGALGSFSGNASGTAAAPVITVTAATWHLENWEEKDYVNVNTLSSVFEVTAVNPSTRAITLARISGSDDLTSIGVGTHVVYMQNSKDNDFTGLRKVLYATSGTLYGINVQRRWKAYQKQVSSLGLTVDLLNDLILGVGRQSGEVPDVLVMGYTQYRKFLDLLEDKKTYMIQPRDQALKGLVSWKALEYDSSEGPIPVILDRFAHADEVMALNSNHIIQKLRPGGAKWFDDDGTIFLRDNGADTYSARYGCYGDFYIEPSFHGVLYGLSES